MINLEYRISYAHADAIAAEGVPVHHHNEYWSYAKHLPETWDKSNIDRRTSVAERLLENLLAAGADEKVDLSPLLDDQRVSGEVFGENPLRSMYDIVEELARRYPDHPFYVKWGGGRYEKPGKAFAFYVENKEEGMFLVDAVGAIARDLGTRMRIHHHYGVKCVRDFIPGLDDTLMSAIPDRKGLQLTLVEMQGYPHFFHEVFG